MADAPHRSFTIERVKGRPVIDSDGNNVGTVEDVVIEPGTWKVSGFVVSLRRQLADELRIQRKGFLEAPRIEIGAERIRTVGDNVILNVDTRVIADALREREAAGAPPEPFVPPAEDRVYGPPPYEPPRY